MLASGFNRTLDWLRGGVVFGGIHGIVQLLFDLGTLGTQHFQCGLEVADVVLCWGWDLTPSLAASTRTKNTKTSPCVNHQQRF